MTNVVPFYDAAVQAWDAPDGGRVVATWTLDQLRPPKGDEWADAAIRGHVLEPAAHSYWIGMPRLKAMAVALANFITPLWPDANGGSLLSLAVEKGIQRAVDAMDAGEVFEGRFVGVYLYGLSDIAQEISRLQIYGRTPSGAVRRWTPFRQTLHAWAADNKLTTVIASKTKSEPDMNYTQGMRVHIITAVANPTETGFVYKYAPQG